MKYTDEQLKQMSYDNALELRKDIVFGNFFRSNIKQGMTAQEAKCADFDTMEQLNRLGLGEIKK